MCAAAAAVEIGIWIINSVRPARDRYANGYLERRIYIRLAPRSYPADLLTRLGADGTSPPAALSIPAIILRLSAKRNVQGRDWEDGSRIVRILTATVGTSRYRGYRNIGPFSFFREKTSILRVSGMWIKKQKKNGFKTTRFSSDTSVNFNIFSTLSIGKIGKKSVSARHKFHFSPALRKHLRVRIFLNIGQTLVHSKTILPDSLCRLYNF